MKGAGKIFCVLMLALQPMLAAGCASGETGETLSLPEGYRSLFNFEEYAEFGGVMQKNYFGKYSINTDGRYVKNGVFIIPRTKARSAIFLWASLRAGTCWKRR